MLFVYQAFISTISNADNNNVNYMHTNHFIFTADNNNKTYNTETKFKQ